MVNRQQRNDLPAAASKARPKNPNQSGNRVWHLNTETGQVDWQEDFSEIDLSVDLQSMFARAFAERLASRGGWNSPVTAAKAWRLVRQFAKFCSGLQSPPQAICDLSKEVLTQFASQGSLTTAMQLAIIFRDDPELPTDSRDWAHQRTSKRFAKNGAYTQSEIAASRDRVFGELARIESRIGESLVAARGPAEPGSIASVLQALLLVPYDHAKVAEAHQAYIANSGLQLTAKFAGERPKSINQLAELVFLRRRDVAITVLAIILNTGWNLSSVLLLKPIVPQANPGNRDRGLYSITLDKRRRGNAARFESRHMRYVNAGARSDVLTRVIRMSAPTRAAASGVSGTGSTATLFAYHLKDGRFGVLTTFSSQDAGRRGWPPRMLSPARIRKTVNVVEKRAANQNDEATHFSTYVMPDPLTRKESAPIIAAGLEDALADVNRFKGAMKNQAPSSSDETVLSACLDRHSSPFESDASGCLSSFLLCLACTNAVITPAHIPRLVVAWDSLRELRSAVPEAQWQALWATTFSRLCDLKQNRISPKQWETGRLAISEADRTLVAQLLQGDLDVK